MPPQQPTISEVLMADFQTDLHIVKSIHFFWILFLKNRSCFKEEKEFQLSDLDFVLKATMTEPSVKGCDHLGWIPILEYTDRCIYSIYY